MEEALRDLRSVDRGTVLQWAVAALTAALVLAPLVPVVLQSLMAKPLYDGVGGFGLANYAKLLTSAALRESVANSLVFAFMTTLLALAIGAGFAIAVGRTDVPGARFFAELLLWPLYLSQLVMAFGFSIMKSLQTAAIAKPAGAMRVFDYTESIFRSQEKSSGEKSDFVLIASSTRVRHESGNA